MVSTLLKKTSSNWKSSPNRGENKTYLSCHHLVNVWLTNLDELGIFFKAYIFELLSEGLLNVKMPVIGPNFHLALDSPSPYEVDLTSHFTFLNCSACVFELFFVSFCFNSYSSWNLWKHHEAYQINIYKRLRKPKKTLRLLSQKI